MDPGGIKKMNIMALQNYILEIAVNIAVAGTIITTVFKAMV